MPSNFIHLDAVDGRNDRSLFEYQCFRMVMRYLEYHSGFGYHGRPFFRGPKIISAQEEVDFDNGDIWVWSSVSSLSRCGAISKDELV